MASTTRLLATLPLAALMLACYATLIHRTTQH